MKLYLAHPIDTRTVRRQWELAMEEQYGIQLINPFYDLTREDIEEIDDGLKEKYQVNPEEIVLRDIEAIAGADGVIAFIGEDTSYGIVMEIVYAYTLGVPVLVCCTNGHHKHPWLQYHSDRIFTQEDDVEDFLRGFAKKTHE